MILKPSLHGFEFRFDRKFSNTHRSVSKGLWSLLKVVLRSQSRLQNVVLVFESHVNFTTRIKATTAERKKGKDFSWQQKFGREETFSLALHAPPLIFWEL